MGKLKCPKCGHQLVLEDILEQNVDWEAGNCYQLQYYTCHNCNTDFTYEAFADLCNQETNKIQEETY